MGSEGGVEVRCRREGWRYGVGGRGGGMGSEGEGAGL